MVDAEDLKSFGHCDRVGSSPTIPTILRQGFVWHAKFAKASYGTAKFAKASYGIAKFAKASYGTAKFAECSGDFCFFSKDV